MIEYAIRCGMKLLGSQIEGSSFPELAGFNAEKIDAAVRNYLKLYEENSQLRPLFNISVSEFDSTLHRGGGAAPDFYVNNFKGINPIASEKSPLRNGVTIGLSIAKNDKEFVDRDYSNCRDLNPREVAGALKTINRINQQLKSAGMPRLFFKTEMYSPGVPAPNQPFMHIRSCPNLSSDGKKVGGFYDDHSSITNNNTTSLSATIRLKANRPQMGKMSTLVHEISHMFADHPQDMVDLRKVDPDVLAYMCNYSSRAGTRGSSLIYESACSSAGFLIPLVPVKKIGPIEMLTLKKFYALSEAARYQDVDRAIGEIVKDIRVEYGTRVASQAMGGFFAALIFTSMAYVVSNSGAVNPKKMLLAISAFSQLVGLAVMVSQMPDQGIGLGLAYCLFDSTASTIQTSAAFSGLLSNAGLGLAFLTLLSGQSGFAVGLAAGYGGTLAGRLTAEIFNTLRSGTLDRPAGYIRAHSSNLLSSGNAAANGCVSVLFNRVQTTMVRALPDPLRNVMIKIGEVDKFLAGAIDEYATFNFVYKKLLNEYQQTVSENSSHSTGSASSFHTAMEDNFSDARSTLEELDLEQAVALELGQIDAHSQLEAVELANNVFVDPENGIRPDIR